MKFTLKQTWPVFLLIALAVLFLGDVWFGGRMLLMRDFFFGEGLNRIYFGNSIRSGVFPFWNSLWQCGAPNAAQPYYGTFYPPDWIFIFPKVEWVIRLWWTFHLALAAVSTYALARYWRLSVAPALFAGVSFAFSTTFMAWVEYTPGLCSMPWTPLVFLFASRVIDVSARESSGTDPVLRATWGILRRSAGSVVALSGVWAMQALASPEFAYYTSLLVGGYVVAKWVWLRNWRTVGISVLLLGLASLLALGLAMPQLILTLELMGQSVRAGEVDAFLGLGSAHPRHWLSLLLPYLYGRPGYPNTYWAPKIFEFSFGAFYVGILPLIGAFFCWLRPKSRPAGERRFLIWFLVATVAVGLALAAGRFTPLYPFLHHWLPGLGHLRFPTKFFLFVALAISLLGAFGFQSLLDNAGEKTRSLKVLWWGVVICFGVFICGFLLCLLNHQFLSWLMAHPETPSSAQINDELYDYAVAALVSLAGLILFGLLAFRRGPTKWIQAGVVAVAFANLCFISRQAQPTAPGGIYTRRPEALVQMIGRDLRYRFLSNYNGSQQYFYGDRRADIYDWARNTGATNHVLLEGVQDLATGGMVLGRYDQLFGLLLSSPPPIQDKIADLMALRYIISGAPFEQVLWKNAPRDVQINQRANCLPRAFVVSQWRTAEGEGPVLRTLIKESFKPRCEAVLEPLDGATVPPPSAFSEASLISPEVQALKDHGNSLTLEVSVKDRSLLVLSDTWYPGWTAWVDGIKRPIFRANYLFRGVFLESGAHRVEFIYQPLCFTVGMWIFGVAAAACGGLAWAARSGSRRTPPQSSQRVIPPARAVF